MDHPLRTISYIADIGNMVVLMARRKLIRSRSTQEQLDAADAQHLNPVQDERRQYRMICHVFESEDVRTFPLFLTSLSSLCLEIYLNQKNAVRRSSSGLSGDLSHYKQN